jgi:hypothetical protein
MNEYSIIKIVYDIGRLAKRHISIMSRNSAFRGFKFPKSRNGSTASTDSINNKSTTGGGRISSKASSGSSVGPPPGAHRYNSGGQQQQFGSRLGNHNNTNNNNSSTDDIRAIFAEMFPSWNDEAIQFLTLCLDPEPAGRPGCNALLRLAYFTHDSFPSRFAIS